MSSFLLTALRAAVDAVLPERCAGCGGPGAVLCDACVGASERGAVRYDAGVRVVALGPHDGCLRRAIHALKYRNDRRVARILGRLLGHTLSNSPNVVGPASRLPRIIVPVPLHVSRLRDRGYNQSELIAGAVAVELGSTVEPAALVRRRATASQSALDLAHRETNVRDAFGPGARAYTVAGVDVLLVDDVVTTGATLRACAAVLQECGASSVIAAALAVRL